MSQTIRGAELKAKTQQVPGRAVKLTRTAMLAAALISLGLIAVSPVAAQDGTSCTVEGAIVSNFNGTAIPAGDTIWFNSVFKVSGVGAEPVTVFFTASSIEFVAGATTYTVPVPDSVITFSPDATLATTDFSGFWETTIPSSSLSGNVFLGGVGFAVPADGFQGGIKPVTWRGTFIADTPGVTISWKWGAAVYSNFADESSLGVKPVDDNKKSAYQNSDHAGTPENFKHFVIGGARGGGGSNFTGSYSGTQSTECQSTIITIN